MSLMVVSTRWKDERSCICSCDAPWFDWLCSRGTKVSVASKSKATEVWNFIFLLEVIWVIWFGITFGKSSVNSKRAKLSDWRLRWVKGCSEKLVLLGIEKA